MIDFHIHTKNSDGQYSSAEIVQKCAELGISVFAITDHDTVDGLEEAKQAVKALKKQNFDLLLLNGVEININWKTSGEFHLLGLGFSQVSPRFADLLENIKKNRAVRNAEIVRKMNEAGIEATVHEIEAKFAGQVLGRPHFAAFLVERGVAKNISEAFEKYLRRGKPFFEERVGANLDEAVTAIVESGGVPVIAHPLSLYESWSKLENTLQNLFERGVAGLEAYHSGAKLTDAKRLEALARQIGMFVTAGSDFHGEKVRADRKLGRASDGKKIEDRFWTEEVAPALEKLKI